MKIWLYLPFLVTLSSCIQADTTLKAPENSYCQIIDKVINLPELQQYFHVNVYPERIPLIVLAEHFISKCSKLNKFGKPIKIVSSNNEIDPSSIEYLKLTKVNISLVNAEITFSYKPEGVKGKVKLKKEKSQWAVSESQIVEM